MDRVVEFRVAGVFLAGFRVAEFRVAGGRFDNGRDDTPPPVDRVADREPLPRECFWEVATAHHATQPE